MTYKKDRKNLRRRFNKYNFRKSWRDENGNLKSFSVTLDTTSLTVARKRAGEILGRWDEVKAGTGFEWSWQGEYNRTTVMERRLDDAIQKYIKHKQADGLKQSSIKRIRNSLDNLISHLGSGFNYTAMDNKDIDSFKSAMNHKSPAGLNVDVRNVRTFCNWLFDTERINRQLVKHF